VNCLDETTIHVDMILYLSLYYLVNDLVHLSNLLIRNYNEMLWKQNRDRKNKKKLYHKNTKP